jgi:hypothetical protein
MSASKEEDASRASASPPQTMEAGRAGSEKQAAPEEPRQFVVVRRSGVQRWEIPLGGTSQNWK